MKGRNCPNCGAVISQRHTECPYCGTSYYDLSTIPAGDPFFLTIKHGDHIITAKAYLNSIELEMEVNALVELKVQITGYLLGGLK